MKLDLKTIQNINLFEKVTNAKVKDCIFREGLVFIVDEGQVQKALKGIRKVSSLLKQDVKVIGFSSEPEKFVRNLIYPVRANIEAKDMEVIVSVEDARMKGKIFGREKSNLMWINSLVGKYFKGFSVRVE